jgi:UDP-2,4-diacetamido-2,4,6-trideoxy-beta-L-altropyranose hydrolase
VLDASDEEIKRLMLASDAAISAAGQTLSELAALGIPGVAIYIADYQLRNWKAWTKKGFIAAAARVDAIMKGLKQLESSAVRRKNSQRLRKTISSAGTFKIVDALVRNAAKRKLNRKNAQKNLSLRKVTNGDCRDLWLWRNTHQARSGSFQSNPIPYSDHERWFERKTKDPNALLLAVQAGEEKVGHVRYDIDGEKAVISILLNPQFYGMGFGTRSIRMADQNFLNRKDAPRAIYAEIQNHNNASIKAFKAAGYKLNERIVRNGKKAGIYQWQG